MLVIYYNIEVVFSIYFSFLQHLALFQYGKAIGRNLFQFKKLSKNGFAQS